MPEIIRCDGCGGDAELCRCSTYIALDAKDALIKAKDKRIAELEAGLKFYAEKSNWEEQVDDCEPQCSADARVDKDQGEKARQILLGGTPALDREKVKARNDGIVRGLWVAKQTLLEKAETIGPPLDVALRAWAKLFDEKAAELRSAGKR